MIGYDPDYVDKLNARYEGGKFLKAAIVTENIGPVVKSYWVDHEVDITFDGQTYKPLHQHWGEIMVSQGMPTEGVTVSLGNVGGQVTKYLKEMDISGNEVVLQLLHLDLLSTLTKYWMRKFKVLAIQYNNQAAAITVGRILGRNKLPRRIILADEFPGLTSDVPRIL